MFPICLTRLLLDGFYTHTADRGSTRSSYHMDRDAQQYRSTHRSLQATTITRDHHFTNTVFFFSRKVLHTTNFLSLSLSLPFYSLPLPLCLVLCTRSLSVPTCIESVYPQVHDPLLENGIESCIVSGDGDWFGFSVGPGRGNVCILAASHKVHSSHFILKVWEASMACSGGKWVHEWDRWAWIQTVSDARWGE